MTNEDGLLYSLSLSRVPPPPNREILNVFGGELIESSMVVHASIRTGHAPHLWFRVLRNLNLRPYLGNIFLVIIQNILSLQR